MALVRRAPKSETVLGSVKTAVGKISPLAKPGSHCFFCSSVPPQRINSAAISVLVPSEPTPIYPIDNSSDFIDNAKCSSDTKLGNQFIPSKSTHINEANQEAFDLQTYKKFLSFLKFQEMMDKYNT